MKDQPIATLMHKSVKVIALDDTIAAVETILNNEGLTWAPVVDEGSQIIGVISASDLMRFHKRERDPINTKAWQASSYRPIVVEQSATISEVANLMVDRKIHHVAVVENGRLRGVVSSLDFVKLMR
jgi:CBS domain-containing protein